jgi:malonyl CoA-acyl carrier protein transacylase
MSVLRYNIVSDKKPYKPREEYLKNFFSNVKRGLQPVNSNGEESTIITGKATQDSSAKVNKSKGGQKRKVKSVDSGSPKKKTKSEDKIKGHKFSS